MRKVIIITATIILTNTILAQERKCARITNFGESKICLSEVEGYKECYLEPAVKELADMTEVPINMVLGFYLNNSIYNKRDSLGLISFDDYFKVYGTKEIKDYEADSKILKEMQDILARNFISKNWDKMEKEIDKIGLEVEVGVPTVIKSYNLNDNSFTYIMLTKYELEGIEPYTLAMTVNGILINKRFIWMAYYLNYKGESTITKLQNNSNEILAQLMNGS